MPDIEKCNKMVIEYLGYAYFFARKNRVYASRNRIDYPELLSLCMEGLILASRGYDISRNDKFSAFADLKMRCILSARIRFLKSKKRNIELTEFGNEANEVVANEPDLFDVLHKKELVAYGIECLTSQEKTLIRKLYWEGKSPAEVGNEFGLHISSIYRILTKALDKCRNRITAIANEEPNELLLCA